MTFGRTILVTAALAALAGDALAHETGVDRQAMHQRFESMDRMMEQAPGMHGVQLHAMMREHMAMMQQQMTGMHGMYGGHGGTMTGPGSGPGMGSGMGPGMMQRHGDGAAAAPDGDMRAQIAAMHERLDAMQQMMEQMLDQQQLMLRDGAE